MELNRQYIVNEANQRVAVQLDIATFEKMEDVLENYALVQLMDNDESYAVLDKAWWRSATVKKSENN